MEWPEDHEPSGPPGYGRQTLTAYDDGRLAVRLRVWALSAVMVAIALTMGAGVGVGRVLGVAGATRFYAVLGGLAASICVAAGLARRAHPAGVFLTVVLVGGAAIGGIDYFAYREDVAAELGRYAKQRVDEWMAQNPGPTGAAGRGWGPGAAAGGMRAGAGGRGGSMGPAAVQPIRVGPDLSDLDRDKHYDEVLRAEGRSPGFRGYLASRRSPHWVAGVVQALLCGAVAVGLRLGAFRRRAGEVGAGG